MQEAHLADDLTRIRDELEKAKELNLTMSRMLADTTQEIDNAKYSINFLTELLEECEVENRKMKQEYEKKIKQQLEEYEVIINSIFESN